MSLAHHVHVCLFLPLVAWQRCNNIQWKDTVRKSFLSAAQERRRENRMSKPVEKAPKDVVHQLAIDRETIKKELRTQKLHTTFNINPRTKFHCITGKPNVRDRDMEGEKDQNLANILWRSFLEPRMKYTFPQTEAQEIGWITTPLSPAALWILCSTSNTEHNTSV
ncbi:cilia- and flagella-associated protein 144 isoform X2 [Scyliorhinus torazame]|uniref:cilia- and flagella-associated protein 144 isoform X2 n=1 Tax=Scyliorhinus torazame TaxID=75743 RepID=UPI003B59CA8D